MNFSGYFLWQYSETLINLFLSLPIEQASPCNTAKDAGYLAEIEQIRQSLLQYKHDRQRLRALREHLSSLTDCLSSLSDDGEHVEATTEINQVCDDNSILHHVGSRSFITRS